MESGASASLAVSKTDTALANLRSRALDLHARLSELRDALAMLRDGVGPAKNAPWTLFLDKFESLSRLYSQMTTELERAVTEIGFRSLLLQPEGSTKALEGPNAAIPSFEDLELVPALLRTALEPEVEKAMDDLEARIDANETPPLTPHDTERRILMFNTFIGNALERFDDARELSLEDERPPEAAKPGFSREGQALLSALASGSTLP